jgi:hypothetical protein
VGDSVGLGDQGPGQRAHIKQAVTVAEQRARDFEREHEPDVAEPDFATSSLNPGRRRSPVPSAARTTRT